MSGEPSPPAAIQAPTAASLQPPVPKPKLQPCSPQKSIFTNLAGPPNFAGHPNPKDPQPSFVKSPALPTPGPKPHPQPPRVAESPESNLGSMGSMGSPNNDSMRSPPPITVPADTLDGLDLCDLATLDLPASDSSYPLLGMFYAQFDNKAGPVLMHQSPAGCLSPQLWACVCDFFITERDLCRKIVTVTVIDFKIVGFPMFLEHEKYDRHTLFFNVGLVFHRDVDTRAYEPVLGKLACMLETLELECEYLFNKDIRRRLGPLLRRILTRLNTSGECTDIIANEHTRVALKLFPPRTTPARVSEHQVPVLIKVHSMETISQWGLSVRQILAHIDGVNHIKQIALKSEVELPIVVQCVHMLVYYGIVKMIDVFQYSNVYVATASLGKLYRDPQMQAEVCHYVRANQQRPAPSFALVFRCYASLQRGLRMGAFCTRLALLDHNVDPRKLVAFGLVNDVIRRVHKYPITRPRPLEHTVVDQAGMGPSRPDPFSKSSILAVVDREKQHDGVSLLDGTHSYDNICCRYRVSYLELDSDIRSAPDCVIISR